MDKILTVVIPSYNTSKFMESSIPTITNSMYLNDLEIIIVDDGSKDDTAEVAQRYVDMYPTSVRLISKENGGHGSVINVGIHNAKGKYLKIIDGDDYVDTAEFDRLIGQLESNDADMFISSFSTVSDQTGEIKKVDPTSWRFINDNNVVSSNIVLSSEKCLNKVYGSIHAVTFRTEILKNEDVVMTEKTFYEDTEFVLYPIKYVKSVYISDANVYRYRIDQTNQSVAKSNMQKRVKQLENIVLNVVRFYNLLPENISNANRDYILRATATQIYIIVSTYASFDKDRRKHSNELKTFDDTIKHMCPDIYNWANRYRIVRLARKSRYVLFPLIMKLFEDNTKNGENK